jgi:hypothetical protein
MKKITNVRTSDSLVQTKYVISSCFKMTGSVITARNETSVLNTVSQRLQKISDCVKSVKHLYDYGDISEDGNGGCEDGGNMI